MYNSDMGGEGRLTGGGVCVYKMGCEQGFTCQN